MDQIQGDGSNGIADITSEGGCPISIAFKLSAGEHLHGTPVKFVPIVNRVTSFVVGASARLFSNGPTIRSSNFMAIVTSFLLKQAMEISYELKRAIEALGESWTEVIWAINRLLIFGIQSPRLRKV